MLAIFVFKLLQALDLQQSNFNSSFMNQYRCLSKPALLLTSFVILFTALSFSQPIINYQQVATPTLTAPVDFVNAGDGSNRIFIVERRGVIQVFDANFQLLDTFLTVTGIRFAGGEQGLLSMAFHPDYETNGYFFVYYTNTDGDVELARYKVSETEDNIADPDSKQVLLTMVKNVNESNHNGGDLNFGPDGNLYFGVGDAGGGGDPTRNAQNPQTLYGKMVRVNVDDFTADSTDIPASNPYANSDDTLRRIYAFGLRNPWRWSFDSETGDMWLADVGQGQWEEVNFVANPVPGGLNFGWNCFEGDDDYNGGCALAGDHSAPIFYYPHNNTVGGISVTGGFVYRGDDFPLLNGYYIMADYISGNSWLIWPDGTGGWDTTRQSGSISQIVSFGETEDRELYMVTLNGSIYQVTSTTVFPVTITSFDAIIKGAAIELNWRTELEQNVSHYEVDYSTDNRTFTQAGIVKATGASSYRFLHHSPRGETIYYRLKAVDLDNSYKYSKVISIRIRSSNGVIVSPKIIQNSILQLQVGKQFDQVQIVDFSGRIIWRSSMVGQTGQVNFALPPINTGTYILRVINSSEIVTERIMIR